MLRSADTIAQQGEAVVTDSRLKKLEAMLESDPQDQLLKYMLALELEKASEHDRSLQLLSELMHSDPPYVPAFLMAGQQQVAIGKPELARQSWQTGIEAARQQQEDHAAGEMAQFLQELG